MQATGRSTDLGGTNLHIDLAGSSRSFASKKTERSNGWTPEQIVPFEIVLVLVQLRPRYFRKEGLHEGLIAQLKWNFYFDYKDS